MKRLIEPERIFVAGPYAPRGVSLHDAPRIAQRNVDRAIEIGNELMRRGHYVHIPHLTHYMHCHSSCTEDLGGWYYDMDDSYIDHWATALFHIAPSPGSNAERKRAEKRGLTIYTKIEQVPNIGVHVESASLERARDAVEVKHDAD